MPSYSIKCVLRSCVTTLALLIAAVPSVAWAQKTAVPVAEEQSKAVKHSPDWAEMRIAKLHTDLHITAAQEAAWSDVATVMRDNAKSMKALIDQWGTQASKMTALDNLKMHTEMADEHAKGMHKLLPVFDKLFNMMSEDQKKVTNSAFAYQESRKHRRGK